MNSNRSSHNKNNNDVVHTPSLSSKSQTNVAINKDDISIDHTVKHNHTMGNPTSIIRNDNSIMSKSMKPTSSVKKVSFDIQNNNNNSRGKSMRIITNNSNIRSLKPIESDISPTNVQKLRLSSSPVRKSAPMPQSQPNMFNNLIDDVRIDSNKSSMKDKKIRDVVKTTTKSSKVASKKEVQESRNSIISSSSKNKKESEKKRSKYILNTSYNNEFDTLGPQKQRTFDNKSIQTDDDVSTTHKVINIRDASKIDAVSLVDVKSSAIPKEIPSKNTGKIAKVDKGGQIKKKTNTNPIDTSKTVKIDNRVVKDLDQKELKKEKRNLTPLTNRSELHKKKNSNVNGQTNTNKPQIRTLSLEEEWNMKRPKRNPRKIIAKNVDANNLPAGMNLIIL